jgi:CDP-diacylglycerol--glycerol-3-phosphate 3-phosphatidyltransferase
VVSVLAPSLVDGLDVSDVRTLACALFVLACLPDLVDGYAAPLPQPQPADGLRGHGRPHRRQGAHRPALIGLSLLGLLPWWAIAVILAREVGITLVRTALLRRGLLPAHRGGKLKCLAQNEAVTLCLLPLTGSGTLLREPVLWSAVALSVVTAVLYAVSGFRLAHGVRLN